MPDDTKGTTQQSVFGKRKMYKGSEKEPNVEVPSVRTSQNTTIVIGRAIEDIPGNLKVKSPEPGNPITVYPGDTVTFLADSDAGNFQVTFGGNTENLLGCSDFTLISGGSVTVIVQDVPEQEDGFGFTIETVGPGGTPKFVIVNPPAHS